MPNYMKPLPSPTPETKPFWDACKQHELLLPYCQKCQKAFFYPRPFCPRCWNTDIEWIKASGRATLHTYTINYRPAPGFESDAPYIIGVVEFVEGGRMMTNIVGIEAKPENLHIGMPLEVVFDDVTEAVTLPKFQPVTA